jgi:hypothetical protein
MSTANRLVAACLLVLVAGVSKGHAEEKAPADKPLATGKHTRGFVVEVTEVKRTSDTFLMISYRFTNPTAKELRGNANATYVQNVYYVEAGGKFKYTVIRGEDRKYLGTDVVTLKLKPGEKRECWAKFRQPGKAIKKITFYVPDTEPIEDIPLPPAK